MKKRNKKNKLNIHNLFIRRFKLIALVLVLLLTLAGYFFFIKPEKRQLIELVKYTLEPKKQEKQAKSSMAERLKESTKHFKIVKDLRLETLETLLPPIEQKENLFLILNNLMSKHDMLIESLDIESPISLDSYLNQEKAGFFAEDYKKIELPVLILPIKLTLSSKSGSLSYDRVKQIIEILSNQSRIFKMSNLEIGELKNEQTGFSYQQQEQKNNATLELIFDTFMIGEEGSLDKEQPLDQDLPEDDGLLW